MATAVFYHHTRSAIEDTLRTVLRRAMGQGWRVMIRSPDAAALTRLDAALWLGDAEAFVPHGLAGGPHDGDQPVLLGSGPVGNGAQGLVLLDGAVTEAAEAEGLDRVWVLFDGADSDAVARARGLWRLLPVAEYWSEEAERWEKKATKP